MSTEPPLKKQRQEPVIVLGAGFAGLTTAAELAMRGHRVRVVAKELGYRPPVTIAGTQSRRHPGIAICNRSFNNDDLLEKELRSINRFLAVASKAESGVSVVPALKVSRKEDVWWNMRALNPVNKAAATEVQRSLRLASEPQTVDQDIKKRLYEVGYKSVDETQVVRVDTAKYFDYLQSIIKQNGGCVCLGCELTHEDVQKLTGKGIVNCLGLASATVGGAKAEYTENSGEELIFRESPMRVPFYIIDDDTNGTIVQRPSDGALCFSSGAKPKIRGGYDEQCSNQTVADADLLSKALFGYAFDAQDASESWATNRPTVADGFQVGVKRREDGQLVVQNGAHAGAGVTASWACASDAVDAFEKEIGVTCRLPAVRQM